MLFRQSQILTYASAFTSRLPIAPYEHLQTQSPLIGLLPAEVRHNIYTHLFAFEDRTLEQTESTGPFPHPLSLLLTCRRIYHEAAILAFSTYIFSVHSSSQWTYLRLGTAVSNLSAHQIEAISTLSVFSDGGSSTGLVLVNALLVFPRLNRFTIRVEGRYERQAWRSVHRSTQLINGPVEDVYLQAVENHPPYWLSQAVNTVTSGRAYAWQDGSKWTAQWPQMEDLFCYSVVDYSKDGKAREELRMGADVVDVIDGVQLCRCGCRDAFWPAVVLKQDGGRKVEVGFRYWTKEPEKGEANGARVRLVPGTAPSAKAIIGEAGVGYEVNEEYWEAIRRRNGNLGALCRGLWNRAVGPVTVANSKDDANGE